MKALLLKITNFLKNNLPLFIVVVIALTVSLKNIIPNTFFSGWDNIHAELNLLRYTKQILTGAWLEYQGLGAPAAQGHLSEIFRLPFLWILSFLFPTNLIRYVYIFSLYIAGGVTMYFYLSKVWLDQKKQLQAQWFACLGSILYLLHILTLQQFHIAFEMFMVQFAFLPLLLLVIHRFKSKLTIKTTLLFF